MKRSDITIEKILTDYQKALEMAQANEKTGDMILAAKEQARLVGLLVEKREIGNAGDFSEINDIADVMAKVAAEIGPEAAQALAVATGMTSAPEGNADEQRLSISGPSNGEPIN